MKSLRIGLKTGDLIGIDHKEVTLTSAVLLQIADLGPKSAISSWVEPGQSIVLKAQAGKIVVGQSEYSSKAVVIRTQPQAAPFTLKSAAFGITPAKQAMTYRGQLEITASKEGMRVVLISDLETYVQGVLQSEVPSYFKLEAMKAQAIVARTYGLHPRLPHEDHVNVCDSYLHCQAFNGIKHLNQQQEEAIKSTSNQILLYQDEPALALFSACAGGHTESYQNCFSDPQTNAFPPPPISYLQGVPEGELPSGFPSEEAMRALFAMSHPHTDDAWSAASFRFQVHLSADALEAHMHHYAQQLQNDPQFAPFVHPPQSGTFGHIKGFTILQRGVAGTAMHLKVDTTGGAWLFDKELTIRSLFENPDIKLKRLKSARIFFNATYDHLGLLQSLQICGFGSGHGVGLQQVGAQGLAGRGQDHKRILWHYYPGTRIGNA
jgi:peptidoglycan hydrolase-like amidase